MPDLEDLNAKIKLHEERINAHDDRLQSYEKIIRALKAADNKLESDIQYLRIRIDNGFSGLNERIDKVHTEALKTVPEDLVSRIALHGLVWKIAGTMALIFGTVAAIVILVK